MKKHTVPILSTFHSESKDEITKVPSKHSNKPPTKKLNVEFNNTKLMGGVHGSNQYIASYQFMRGIKNIIKSSPATGHVRELKLADISETISVPNIRVSDITTEADVLTYVPVHGPCSVPGLSQWGQVGSVKCLPCFWIS